MANQDSIRFKVFVKRKSKKDALITTSSRKKVRVKRTLRNEVEL